MELDGRLTEAGNPLTAGIDRASAARIVELIGAEDRLVAPAVAAEAEWVAQLIEEVAKRIRRGGRLIYVGAGTSGRLGVLDAAECPPTFGTEPNLVRGVIAGGPEALVMSREGVEDDEDAARVAIHEVGVRPADFVLGIAASGSTPFVRAALEEARRCGAGIGLLSCTPPPDDLGRLADVMVTPLVGPEVIAGSTRMKAGTATKLVLNTLTTGVMVRLGKVYRNLMVDLQAGSRKLVDRSIRIVREACGVDEETARRLLLAAGGASKTAIAMHELSTSRAIAERALDECDGFLGEAIDRFGDRTPPYYSGYDPDFGGDDLHRLLDRLRSAHERLQRAVEEEAPPERRTGRWGAREHLAHLVECEIMAFRPRVERILAERSPRFEEWTPSPDPPIHASPPTAAGPPMHADPTAEIGPAQLLAVYAAEREKTIRLIEGLDEAAWSRPAQIGEEPVTLYQFLRGVAHHDEAHALRIRETVHPTLSGG